MLRRIASSIWICSRWLMISPVLLIIIILVFTEKPLAWLLLALGIWAIFNLLMTNHAPAQRYRQWWVTPLVMLWGAIFFWFLTWLQNSYQSALIWLRVDEIWTYLFSTAFPLQDFGHALPLLNTIFLMIPAFFLTGFISIQRVFPGGGPWKQEFAYRNTAAGQICLEPCWLFIRRFMMAASWIGFGALLLMWFSMFKSIHLTWLPILPAAFFLVCLEITLWLGGPLQKSIRQATLDGEEADSRVMANFEALWCLFKSRWNDKWLLAGNRIPQKPRQR